MRKSRFTEGQIVGVLKGDDGVPLAELVRTTASVARRTSIGSRSTPAPRSPI